MRNQRSLRSPGAINSAVTRTIFRGGAASGELALVLAGVACVVICLSMLVRPPEHFELTRTNELINSCELPLGEEFCCVVRLVRFSKPDSTARPHLVIHVDLVCRNPARSDAFLLSLRISTHRQRPWAGTCQTWNLVNADETLDYLHTRGEITVRPSEMSEEERMSALTDSLSSSVQMLKSLDEPVSRCVPIDMQKTGILVLTSVLHLDVIHELTEFPLSRLASAIRVAAECDDWTSEAPMALLSEEYIGDRNLTLAEQRSISQSLVWRLLNFLPQEELAVDHPASMRTD